MQIELNEGNSELLHKIKETRRTVLVSFLSFYCWTVSSTRENLYKNPPRDRFWRKLFLSKLK